MYPTVIKIKTNRPELPPVIKVDGKTFKVVK
jgi:hypothetical protein